jgi:peptidoglycan/LPS O-acetylase OafA/YrhL
MPWKPHWQDVLLNHTGFWGGVDLFFAISGFVIMRSVIETIEITDNNRYWRYIAAFWIRRFYRLAPASWFWLAATAVLSVVYNRYQTFGELIYNIVDAVSQFFYLANWHAYACSHGYGSCGINGIYWSLSLEEQFYMLLPIGIFFLRRRIGWLCAFLIAIQFGLHRSVMDALWLTRVDAVAWGVILALLSQTQFYQHIKPTSLRSTPFRILVGGMLLLSLAVFARGEVFKFFTGAIALCSAVMVWIASYNEGLMFRYLRNSKILLWIGSRSYSIYLSHILAFYIIVEWCKVRTGGTLGPNDTLRIAVGGVILSVLFAEASYRFIEKPFRLRGRDIAHELEQSGSASPSRNVREAGPAKDVNKPSEEAMPL